MQTYTTGRLVSTPDTDEYLTLVRERFLPQGILRAEAEQSRTTGKFFVRFTLRDGTTCLHHTRMRFDRMIEAMEFAHACVQGQHQPAILQKLPARHTNTTARGTPLALTTSKISPTLDELITSHGPRRAWASEVKRLTRAAFDCRDPKQRSYTMRLLTHARQQADAYEFDLPPVPVHQIVEPEFVRPLHRTVRRSRPSMELTADDVINLALAEAHEEEAHDIDTEIAANRLIRQLLQEAHAHV